MKGAAPFFLRVGNESGLLFYRVRESIKLH